MKNNIIRLALFSFIALLTVFTFSFFDASPKYTKRAKKQASHRDAEGAAEYLKAIRNNQITGRVDISDVEAARKTATMAYQNPSRTANTLSWEEMGPDNVGGRTRGFLIDKNNPNKIYVGGVAGGIFISTNGGGTWYRYNNAASPLDNLAISSFAQAANGDIYVGTGESFTGQSGTNGYTEGFEGMGMYKSTDGGATFEHLASTWGSTVPVQNIWKYVNKVAADPVNANRIYAATNQGLRVSDDAGLTWTNNVMLSGTTPNNSPSSDVVVGSNGSVIASIGSQAYVSPNGDLNTFVKKSGAAAGNIQTGAGRLVFAIAPSDPNYVYCSAVTGGGNLDNIYQSSDNGQNWTVIGEGGTPGFDPFANPGINAQGVYDNAIGVDPNNPGRIIVGGVHLWEWKQTQSNPAAGGWNLIATTFDSPTNPTYVHADKHVVQWHPTNSSIIYIGCDGGVFKTVNSGVTWAPLNRNYNITQFYSVAFAPTGEVMGGSQDNGTQLIDFNGNTPQSANEILGGDGGECAISSLANVAFATIYNGTLIRGNGSSGGSFYDANIGNAWQSAGFVTPITLWEKATAPFDTCFVLGVNGAVWMTRGAVNMSIQPEWYKLGNTPGQVSAMAFSKDGNNLYVGTEQGQVYRLSNLLLARNKATADVSGASYLVTQVLAESFGRFVTDIAVDPNDPDNVIVTLGNYGNSAYIYRSTDGTSANPLFTSIHTASLPTAPVYSAVVEMFDNNRVFIGTELGVWGTENAFAPSATSVLWEPQTGAMGNVPVFMIRQQTLPWNLSANSGTIYVGSHGRGFFKSPTYLGINEETTEKETFNMFAYPNPMAASGNISFNLSQHAENVTVKIYNTLGEVVYNVTLKDQAAGKKEIAINPSELKSGTYFVSIDTKGKRETSKFIVAK